MPLSLQVQAGYLVDNTQKKIVIAGQLKVIGSGNYPVGGIPLDAVLLALPEATTNSGVRRCPLLSLLGTGYIYQRIPGATPGTGTMMVLQVPPNGSLTTAAPLQQIPSSTNMQGVQNDLIDFEAEFLRNA
jgi:hypothetical protein